MSVFLAVLLAAQAVTSAGAECPYGICSHLTFQSSFPTRVRSAEQIRSLGFRWVRCDFRERDVATTLDPVVNDVAKSGILDILGIIGPPHKSAGPIDGRLKRWEDYVRNLVIRYGDSIHTWEICNEVNVERFWPGCCSEDYADALSIAYRAIKAVDPKLKVTTSGIARIDTNCIDRIYRRVGKDCFDVMNVHWYNLPGIPEGSLDVKLRNLRALMTRYGDSTKPIWLTEYGYGTQVPSESVRGIVRAGLAVVDSQKEGWKILVIEATSGKGRITSRRLREGLRGILPKGAEVSLTTAKELGDALNVRRPDAVLCPFKGAYGSKVEKRLAGFLASGGTVICLGGSPSLANVCRGMALREAAHPFPLRLAERAGKCMLPKRDKDGKSFVDVSGLSKDDRLTPLVFGRPESGGEVVCAGVLRSGGAGCGAVVFSTLAEVENWCPATEEEQAWMVARASSIALDEGVEKLFWYNFRSQEKDLYDRESHFGIVRKDFSEKPSAQAWRTFIRMRPVGSVQMTDQGKADRDSGIWHSTWKRPDGTTAGVVWTPHKAFEIAGHKASEDIRFFDCFGGELRVDVRDGKFALEISESPVYYLGVLGDVKPKSLR